MCKRTAIALTLALSLVADQASKAVILAKMAELPVTLTPFFNIVLVWNKGISFGMLTGNHLYAPYILSFFALLVMGCLAVWLRKVDFMPLVIAISAVIGGAAGNVIDRLRFGAVLDFLDFHAAGYHWPAFNIADMCVVAGIAFIVLDGLFFEPKRKIVIKSETDETA